MKIVEATNFKKVDTTMYVDGDIFISEKEIGILHQGTIEPLMLKSDMRGYVKKSDVQKMIDEALKKGGN